MTVLSRISSGFVNQIIFFLLLLILQQPTCLVTSSSNSGNSNNKFGVHMIRSPESNIAPQGDEVQFECELNLEPDRLEWRFLAQDRLGRSKSDYIYMNSNNGFNVTLKERVSKLTVVVSHQTVGEYQCIAWIGASALASLPAKLSLATISLDSSGAGKNYKSYPSRQQQQLVWKVSPGNSVIIKCGEVISFPPPVWTFYKDTVAVPSSVPQLPSGALVLSPVTQRDSGTYYCSAVNSITGTDLRTPQNTTLVVDFLSRSAPVFLSSVPKNFATRPGTSIILECPGVGNPVPKAIWSRPDKDIPKLRSRYLPYGLELLNVTDDDQGAYICTLDNGIAPTYIHKVYLTVLEPPEIIEPPKASLINEGDYLERECIAVGSPEPKIHWMINGDDTRWDPLVKTEGNKLYISSVEKKHAGIIQCFASNEAGEETASNSLHVSPKQIPGGADSTTLGLSLTTTKAVNDYPGKPNRGKKKHKRPEMVPPSRPSVTRLSDENVMVRWSVPSNDGLPIQFFKVQYRTLSDPARHIQRTSWMTANEDIPPHVTSYEVEGLKPDRYYRFRIAAVYSNNDNKLGPTSGRFHLQRGEKLGAAKSHLPAPTLSRIEPISETEMMLYWEMLNHSSNIDGFYAYYRPSTSAGEYSKATVDGHHARSFKIDHLEPGTAYEFKLQSFTASAASDFSAILTKKTLKPSTPVPPFNPTVIPVPDQVKAKFELLPLVAAIGVGTIILSVIFALICFAFKRRRSSMDDTLENKAHPDIIQSESNGFAGSPLHKTSRMNGMTPRMTITANPLAQESDKNRNIMELRFLPNTMTTGNGMMNGHAPGNGVSPMVSPQPSPSPLTITPTDMQLPPLPHRRTLERSLRNFNNINGVLPNGIGDKMMDGDCGVAQVRTSSMRRSKRNNNQIEQGSVPSSPRVTRGSATDLVQHKFLASPIPIRAHNAKRTARLGRAENMSNGSLNSIEV